METNVKLALFVGGNADGQIIDITEVEPRLDVVGSAYISKGSLMTSKYGTVQIYLLEGMKDDEQSRRMEIIKKVL